MTTTDTSTDQPGEMRCPTCGASQPLSNLCRRCRCDLSLVRQVIEYRQRLRAACARQISRGQKSNALKTARQCFELSPDEHSTRLLAVAHLINGDFEAAKCVSAACRP